MTTTTQSLSANDVKDKILSSKGSFVKAKWKSNPKPSAANKQRKLEKITESVVRAGIDYSNLSSVKQGIEEGTRGPVQELPWGTWKQFPYIIEHKGNEYIRLYPSDGINHVPKSKFYVDDAEVDKVTFASYLTPGDAKKLLDPEERPECFTIKSENVLGIDEEND